MPEKQINEFLESLRTAFPFITTIFLSFWGGTVFHIQKLRKAGKKFGWSDYWFDIIVCSFAGMLTHFFCKFAVLDEWMSVILISISAHMGTRAIAGFERLHSRIIGSEGEK